MAFALPEEMRRDSEGENVLLEPALPALFTPKRADDASLG
jgi:hypothetical protein